MAADNIRTRWHRVQAAFEAGVVTVQTYKSKPPQPLYKGTARMENVAQLLGLVDNLPKYFIEPNLMAEMETNQGLVDSLKAMHEAGITRLPFPAVLVETEGSAKQEDVQVRNFIVLSERKSQLVAPGENYYHPFRANLFRLTNYQGQDAIMLCPATYWLGYIPDAEGPSGTKGFGIHFNTTAAPYMDGVPDEDLIPMINSIGYKDFRKCGNALDAMMVLLNTRGIDKVVIEPTKLNKARKKAGKKEIARHSIIRLGHAYSRDGKKREGVAWHQQFHIRPGYINHYWYGPRTEGHKSGERRAVFVESYVINAPEDETIKPKVPEAHLRS